ncbi:putative acetyltransferase (plasmid) [Burkholderia gladioli]|nr:putative acetyltransferase [Burkholderia gladioli]
MPDAVRGRFRRNIPDPIPVVALWLLADDRRVLHTVAAIAIRGLSAHAISVAIDAYYERGGFEAFPLDPTLLLITLADFEAAMKRGHAADVIDRVQSNDRSSVFSSAFTLR